MAYDRGEVRPRPTTDHGLQDKYNLTEDEKAEVAKLAERDKLRAAEATNESEDKGATSRRDWSQPNTDNKIPGEEETTPSVC